MILLRKFLWKWRKGKEEHKIMNNKTKSWMKMEIKTRVKLRAKSEAKEMLIQHLKRVKRHYQEYDRSL